MKTLPLPVVAAAACGFAALLALTGCAKTAAKPVKPPPATTAATAPPVPGAAVTFTEADTGKTAHVELGQIVAFQLAVNAQREGDRWFLRNRLEGGVLFKKGGTTYSTSSTGTVATVLYQAGKPGSQELHFYFAPPDARQSVARAADFRVTVK